MADQIVVSETALGYLDATRPWVKFLAIVGFIGIALMVLLALAMLGGVSAIPGQPALGAVFAVFYLLFAVLYLMPCLFLYRYGKAISAIPATGQAALEDALKNQKSFWKFMGIVMAIVLSLELLFVLIGIIVALAARH